jgi:S-methylmethionine-dependent homocysteine/selenocysteine methylase
VPDSARIPSLERDKLYIGDEGLETTMIFERGIELPEVAPFLLTRALKPRLAGVRVLAGCCGSDSRHVARICEQWLS